MTVLLRLTDARLRRVGLRLSNGRPFTVTVPEQLIWPHRRVRGHEKVPAGGHVQVPAGGHVEVPPSLVSIGSVCPGR